MINEGNISALYFNPLLIGVPKNKSDHKQIAANFFDFIAEGTNLANRCGKYLDRLERMKKFTQQIVIIPSDERLREKLIKPFRQAFASYLTGDFLGTLALCGMIGEMLAIFKFEISNIQVQDHRISRNKEKLLFGNSFEKLGQERRIEVLLAYDIISEEHATDLEKIRKIRNNYLHYWSRDHDQPENDAYQVFQSTINTIGQTFPQHFDNGRLMLPPEVLDYLERAGVYKRNVDQS